MCLRVLCDVTMVKDVFMYGLRCLGVFKCVLTWFKCSIVFYCVLLYGFRCFKVFTVLKGVLNQAFENGLRCFHVC